MKKTIGTKTSTKIFCGYLLTSEIKMHLNDSLVWKMAKITPSSEDLIEVRYKNKDYFGRYLEAKKFTLADFKAQEETFSQKLHFYCPKLDIDRCKFQIFSQYFIH